MPDCTFHPLNGMPCPSPTDATPGSALQPLLERLVECEPQWLELSYLADRQRHAERENAFLLEPELRARERTIALHEQARRRSSASPRAPARRRRSRCEAGRVDGPSLPPRPPSRSARSSEPSGRPERRNDAERQSRDRARRSPRTPASGRSRRSGCSTARRPGSRDGGDVRRTP